MKHISITSVVLIAAVLLGLPMQSSAWRGSGNGGYGQRNGREDGWHGDRGWRGDGGWWGGHYHPFFDWYVSLGYSPIWVCGVPYLYYDGDYYWANGENYVLVTPPAGAVVSTIPGSYKAVTINGVTYFTNGGVYYVNTANGFVVVTPPAPAAATPQVATTSTPQQASATASQPPAAPKESVGVTAASDESFTVNIPNAKGGYTPVVIKRSGEGFVGPQGEFYPQFPKVSQLKAMYGK